MYEKFIPKITKLQSVVVYFNHVIVVTLLLYCKKMCFIPILLIKQRSQTYSKQKLHQKHLHYLNVHCYQFKSWHLAMELVTWK